MDDLLHHLEARVKALTERCDHLIGINKTLTKNSELLLQEKTSLLTKNKMAITQIQEMVMRLKSLEEVQ